MKNYLTKILNSFRNWRQVKIHKSGWGAVFAIYSARNFKASIVLPTVLSILSISLCFLSRISTFLMVKYMSEMTIQIVPMVLGFVLSGYALFMGLNDSTSVKDLLNYKPKDRDCTLFQDLNTVFAVVLYSSFLTCILGVTIGFICSLEIKSFDFYRPYIDITNRIVLFILLFMIYYTINSIKDVVINIFNYGQYIQAKNDRIKKAAQERQSEKNNL